MLHRHFRHILAVLEHRETLLLPALEADWHDFVAAVTATPSTCVVDGALAYAAVRPLLAADLPDTTIRHELDHIAGLCAPLQPRVIHLTGDVDRIAHASYAQRGAGWQAHSVGQSDDFAYQQRRGRSGIPGVAAFFQDAQARMHAVLADGGWETLTLAVTVGEWDALRQAIMTFLGIPAVRFDPPPHCRGDLHLHGTLSGGYPGRAGRGTDHSERGRHTCPIRTRGADRYARTRGGHSLSCRRDAAGPRVWDRGRHRRAAGGIHAGWNGACLSPHCCCAIKTSSALYEYPVQCRDGEHQFSTRIPAPRSPAVQSLGRMHSSMRRLEYGSRGPAVYGQVVSLQSATPMSLPAPWLPTATSRAELRGTSQQNQMEQRVCSGRRSRSWVHQLYWKRVEAEPEI